MIFFFFFASFPIAFPYSNCFKRATWKGFSTLLNSGELGHMRKLRLSVTVPADVAALLPASGASAVLLARRGSRRHRGATLRENQVGGGRFKQTPQEKVCVNPQVQASYVKLAVFFPMPGCAQKGPFFFVFIYCQVVCVWLLSLSRVQRVGFIPPPPGLIYSGVEEPGSWVL